jgi:hypothetical protein
MRSSVISFVVYVIVAAPVGWLLWQLTGGVPVKVRLVFLGAFVLGMVQPVLHRWVARGETARRVNTRRNGG